MATQIATRRVALAVGIIILAVTTVAVISIVKQRGEAARHAEVTKIADAKLKQLESETSTKKSDEKKDSGATSETKAPESIKKEEQGTATLPGTTSQGQESTSELPQTGPASLLVAIPLGLTTFAAMSYLQSRRLRL